MLGHRVRVFWTNHRRKFIVGSLLLLALIWVYYGIYAQQAPVEETILFLVLFISASIELVAKEVLELRDELSSPAEIHETSVSTLEPLKNIIREEGPMTVYLLEYNSTSVEELLDAAIANDCDVYLLIKDPRFARNASQKANIRSQLTTIYEKHYNYNKLRIHFYSKPSSLKARLLNGTIICTGWYTFDDRGIDREEQVWGKDNPMVCTSRRYDTEKFEAITDWFKSIYFDLWTSGISFRELYFDDDFDDFRRNSVLSEEWVDHASGSSEKEKSELFRHE